MGKVESKDKEKKRTKRTTQVKFSAPTRTHALKWMTGRVEIKKWMSTTPLQKRVQSLHALVGSLKTQQWSTWLCPRITCACPYAALPCQAVSTTTTQMNDHRHPTSLVMISAAGFP